MVSKRESSFSFIMCASTSLQGQFLLDAKFLSHTCKVIIRNLPLQFGNEDFQNLLSPFGTIQSIERGPGKSENSCSITVAYEAEDQAQQAFTQLHDSEVGGNRIKVDYIMEQGGKGQRRTRQYGSRNEGQGGNNMQRMGFRQSDFPLRILVLSDMVGAIIGKQGGTIRQITQSSHARVDVHRKDNVGSVEKPITIFGNPENCSAACAKILHVMQEEANNTNRGEIPLKLLAHNNLIGRIIGKSGSTIKKIMEETETKITVSR
ncbi:Insulin-like growth factor 2 mRNA-binding protein 3 [Nymphon striatum]|nr:Insulin-like growth factor 2 mRNA-binding protein 3 [Nymphon striatum]